MPRKVYNSHIQAREQAAKAGLKAVRALAGSNETCLNEEARSLYKDFFDPSFKLKNRLTVYKELIENFISKAKKFYR